MFGLGKKSGYIYVVSNPAMPGLVKIGMTRKPPDERIRELFSTGVPLPFQTEYYCWVPNRRQAENKLHDLFNDQRVSSNREFFRLDVDKAVQATARAVGRKKKVYSPRSKQLRRRKWKILLALVALGIFSTAVYPGMDKIRHAVNSTVDYIQPWCMDFGVSCLPLKERL